jgi:hypothetical protein
MYLHPFSLRNLYLMTRRVHAGRRRRQCGEHGGAVPCLQQRRVERLTPALQAGGGVAPSPPPDPRSMVHPRAMPVSARWSLGHRAHMARGMEALLLLLVAACVPGGFATGPPEPTITDVSPNNGPTKGGTIVTIGGANFGTGDSKAQPQVSVGGAACQQVVWVSSTSILCETPDGVGGHKSVMVSVDGVNSSPDQDALFNYDPPTVEAIEPGHGAASGGTVVTVIGNNFGATNNNPSVTIGGRPCLSVVWLSDSKLKCVSPAGIGIGDVRVFILDESSPENFGTIFEFDAPLITRIVPDHGPGTGGYTITVHGTNFGTVDSKPQIKVGSHRCQSTEWKGNTEVLCTVPEGHGTNQAVLVDILGQPSKSGDGHSRFSYDGPEVTALDPANGPTEGSAELTVYGSNFGTKKEGKKVEVRVGEVPCATQTWISQTAITCVTPAGTGTERQVDVQVIGERSAPCSAKQKRHHLCPSVYNYDAPTIQGVEPAHGPTTGGFYVNVNGDNYGIAPSAIKIMVGKVECEKTNWVSNTMAQCLMPAGVGFDKIRVQVDGQESHESALVSDKADTFTYDAPVIDRVLPSAGNPSGGQLVTVEGRNFGTVKDKVEALVGDVPGRVVSVNEDRVLLVMPEGEGRHAIRLRVADLESHVEAPETPQQKAGVEEISEQPVEKKTGTQMPKPVPADDYKYRGPAVTAVEPVHGVTQVTNVCHVHASRVTCFARAASRVPRCSVSGPRPVSCEMHPLTRVSRCLSGRKHNHDLGERPRGPGRSRGHKSRGVRLH